MPKRRLTDKQVAAIYYLMNYHKYTARYLSSKLGISQGHLRGIRRGDERLKFPRRMPPETPKSREQAVTRYRRILGLYTPVDPLKTGITP